MKIRLANRSRKNRMFYDSLIKDIAICLNTGDRELNRFLLHPYYRSLQKKDPEAVNIGSCHQQVGFDSAASMLPVNVLDEIDLMLSDAPFHLCHCDSRADISTYIKECTDLTDCHLTSLNTMQTLK